MSTERREGPAALSAAKAGEVLGLPADVVRALADAGYLRPADLTTGSPRFALRDLKAFQARLLEGTAPADVPETSSWDQAVQELDPDALLTVLDGKASEMAERTLDLLVAVFPEAAGFAPEQRRRFLDEAKLRLEAILALCTRGPDGDEPLEIDLADVGADAANAGVPLPGLLMTLRFSRDLVVQTAIQAAEERGGNWALALAVTLTRVMPSIDRLTDAVARGYWEALIEIESEGIERYRNVVELASDGVFELDDDGIVRYANPAMVELLGEVAGMPVQVLLSGFELGARDSEVTAGGTAYRVRQFEQLRDGVVAGWLAVLAPLTPC